MSRALNFACEEAQVLRLKDGSMARLYTDGVEQDLVIVVGRIDERTTEVVSSRSGKSLSAQFPRDDLVPVDEDDVLSE